MLIWIFFWWLLGLLILGAALWRFLVLRDFTRVTFGDAVAFVIGPLVWPMLIAIIAIEFEWIDVPVFDLDWFRRNRDE